MCLLRVNVDLVVLINVWIWILNLNLDLIRGLLMMGYYCSYFEWEFRILVVGDWGLIGCMLRFVRRGPSVSLGDRPF